MPSGTPVVSDDLVSANAAPRAISGGGSFFNSIIDFGLLMKTVTPGTGTLLVTIAYGDTSGTPQALNVSLALTAGNLANPTWAALSYDQTQILTIAYTYIGGGGVSGTCQVTLCYAGFL